MIEGPWYKGRVRSVWLMPGAKESLQTASCNVVDHVMCAARLCALLRRIGNVGCLRSKDAYQDHGDSIFSVKTYCGVYGYGWKEGRNLVVSHFAFKGDPSVDDFDDTFTDSDRKLVLTNRDHYERSK